MDFRKFLALADRLAQGTSQAEWRTAISRAYYAAFHVAAERVEQMGFRVPRKTEQIHVYVARRFGNAGIANVSSAGSDLNDLRTDRNRADYEKATVITAANAADSVDIARRIIAVLDDLRKDAALSTQITEAIKKYERDVLKEATWRA